ncbi:MAG TPA: hypothetical protein PKW02_03350 [Pseudomonadales bacterium]|jgi:hypothetical protein|nr:hypothetical protein [Pseudomonadales bacterium]
MIFESELWKKSLLKTADSLERRYNPKKWNARSMFLLERDLFLGFFSVRKLIESNAVSDKLKGKSILLAVYPVKSKGVILLNQHRFSEFYDLYAGQKESMSYQEICNQFIHSAIYSPFIPGGSSLVGIFFSSDYRKNKTLFYIPLVKVVEIMRCVGSNQLKKLKVTFDEKNKEYVVKSSAVRLR